MNKEIYKNRRVDFLNRVKVDNPKLKKGAILLVGDFENSQSKFWQESFFYYLTGIDEPAVFLLIDFNGKETLFVPNYDEDRSKWTNSKLCNKKDFKVCQDMYQVDRIDFLGDEIKGYVCPIFFDEKVAKNLLKEIEKYLKKEVKIFTANFVEPKLSIYQRVVFDHINSFLSGFKDFIVDVTVIVSRMRRKKSREEMELIFKAVDLTINAHFGLANIIKEGKEEAELAAGAEYIFKKGLGCAAFPPIVATGKNSTILHYQAGDQQMKNGELIIVDIGARLDYYCADITRTYPVAGKFTKKQKELYQMVLNAQQYIADKAIPGCWFFNKKEEKKSLHHLALKFFEKHGYKDYFTHSIGHFLGLDVHDVGDLSEPLGEGDVFTIEPGIYIPEENIGIRIEDDYWMLKDGVMSLSEGLPKDIDTIEKMVQYSDDSENVVE